MAIAIDAAMKHLNNANNAKVNDRHYSAIEATILRNVETKDKEMYRTNKKLRKKIRKMKRYIEVSMSVLQEKK